MKWKKTKLGLIAYAPKVDGKLPEIPEGVRIGMPWELLQIYIEEKSALSDFPKFEYIWCGVRACGLYILDFNSNFDACVRNMDFSDCALSGVFFIKEER